MYGSSSNKMRDRSSRQDDRTFPPEIRTRSRTPSFSSTLLDTICRSIDQPCNESEPEPHQFSPYREADSPVTIKKQSNGGGRQRIDHSLKRAIMVETWMEKQTADPNPAAMFLNSGSSSSESSSGGGGCGTLFSSSETESSYREKVRSSGFTMSRPKNVSEKENQKSKHQNNQDGFSKTKLRALKIYGELKKVKQPISPGGRISSFLNSIFSSGAGNGRKAKMCSVGAVDDVNFECKSKSACSSASSFSRSCMNKTGRKINTTGAKRSVRFYPVSVIVDEDSRPCGHKCIYEDDPSLMPTPMVAGKDVVIKKQSMNINAGVEAAAREFLMRTYQKGRSKFDDDEEDDEDEDDAKSCASSDLFELDHLVAGRYREELPVYETTSLRTNKAIANGFIF